MITSEHGMNTYFGLGHIYIFSSTCVSLSTWLYTMSFSNHEPLLAHILLPLLPVV